MSIKNQLVSITKDVLFVVVFFFLFTSFGYASFHIPSGSMEPTLEVGDRIMISKYSYGYNRYSFPFDPDFIGENHLFKTMPKRGDVAVFTLPERDHTDFIKRVIGMPGDRIQMRSGRLYINGDLIERQFIRDVTYENYQGYRIKIREYDEILPGGRKHRIYERTDDGHFDNTPVYLVPAGHYFMMGDNRDGSSDSRDLRSMGYVKENYLVGKARFTTFSLYDCDQGKDIYCLATIPLGRFFNSLN